MERIAANDRGKKNIISSKEASWESGAIKVGKLSTNINRWTVLILNEESDTTKKTDKDCQLC